MSANPPLGRPESEPLPERGPLRAYLYALRKAHRELVGDARVAGERFESVATRGDARAYIEELLPVLLQERHRRHRR
jgi:hypothetical protein